MTYCAGAFDSAPDGRFPLRDKHHLTLSSHLVGPFTSYAAAHLGYNYALAGSNNHLDLARTSCRLRKAWGGIAPPLSFLCFTSGFLNHGHGE